VTTVAVEGAPTRPLRIARRGTKVVLVVFPLVLVALLVVVVAVAGRHGSDFATFWDSGRAVVHGRSPYPSLASLPRRASPTSFAPFVYPPVTAFAMAPLGLLPFSVAIFVFLVLDLAAVALALRLLGVDDWRCYALAYSSVPVFSAAGLGTISPLLLLATAAAWRYRDRALAVGALVAYVSTAKLFLWPVWLWLVRTRRFRAAAVAAVLAAAGVFASWAAIGFAGLRDYPHLLGRLTELVGGQSYSAYALGRALGLARTPAQLAAEGAAILALLVAARLLRDDGRLLTAAVAAALVLTPILWPHYLVLLFVPIALARPRFSPLWLAPVLLWVDSSAWSHGSAIRIAGALAVAAVVFGISFQARAVSGPQ
jgi:hypothetical protein